MELQIGYSEFIKYMVVKLPNGSTVPMSEYQDVAKVMKMMDDGFTLTLYRARGGNKLVWKHPVHDCPSNPQIKCSRKKGECSGCNPNMEEKY